MLNGDYFKTLCPVCETNLVLKDFKLHMESKHTEFSKAVNITDETYNVLYQSTGLKNVVNNVYYNWDYHIQTKYKITSDDKRNYKGVMISLKQSNSAITHQNIYNYLKNLDSKYGIEKLGLNIVRVLIDDDLFG